jgi:O-antigen ligase
MGAPNLLVWAALLAFPLASAACFRWLGGSRGMLAALLGGWLFLPWFNAHGDAVPLLHAKETLVPAVVLLTSLALDGAAWRRLRLGAFDLPMALLCAVPFGASIANGLGAYDGLQAVLEATMAWGAPYLLGRVYVWDLASAERMAAAVVLAGVAYAPLCLWEVRMSPQLHRTFYGFHQHFFAQQMRAGGFRPMVFMYHGLAVAFFMACAALVAYWIWRAEVRRTLLGVRLGWIVLLLVVVTVLCKSAGAMILLLLGVLVLEGTRRYGTALLVAALLAGPPAYVVARLSGWNAAGLLDTMRRLTGDDRAASLAFRIGNEDQLIAKALQRPVLGWGRWGRARVYDEEGEDVSVTDGLWVITLGDAGLVGLSALLLTLAMPAFRLLRVARPRSWGGQAAAPAAAFAVACALWSIDNLPNGCPSPIPPMLAGAVGTLAALAAAQAAPARARVAPGARRSEA